MQRDRERRETESAERREQRDRETAQRYTKSYREIEQQRASREIERAQRYNIERQRHTSRDTESAPPPVLY